MKEIEGLRDILATQYGDDLLEGEALLEAGDALGEKLLRMQLNEEILIGFAAYLLLERHNDYVLIKLQEQALSLSREVGEQARKHADLSERAFLLLEELGNRRVNDVVEQGVSVSARLLARRGGMARNKSNQEGKNAVFEWLDQNLVSYSGKLDAAADAIAAAGVASVEWRTIRAYITEYRKLRSAGTE